MTVMTEEWVSFWYQCLSENSDYSSYCTARERDDKPRRAALEKRFDKVAGIYDDFGEMDGWPDGGIKSPRWKAWFEPRRHLFISAPSEVTEAAQHKRVPGHLLLDIPMGPDADSTAKSVSLFLKDYYATHEVVPAPKPKYQLNMINGRVAHGYQKVRQACVTSYRSYAFDVDQDGYLPLKEVILVFLRNELDTLDWKMRSATRKELMERGTMPPEEYDLFRVRVNKARRDFVALSKGAIHGRFPDETYSDTQVMDQFWGELTED